MNLDVLHQFERVVDRYQPAYERLIGNLLLAVAAGNHVTRARTRDDLAATIAAATGVSAVVGATASLREAAGVLVDENLPFRAGDRDRLLLFRDPGVPATVPAVELVEAIDEMVRRTPVTLRGAAERMGARVAELYRNNPNAIAFAKSAEDAVTEKVHSLIVQAMREGLDESEAVARIRTGVDEVRTVTEGWTRAYAQTAFRTNVATAVTAGKFVQARDPDIAVVIPCMQFATAGDSDVRPNHRAADGIVLRTDNPAWGQIAPPLGYRCRCDVVMVSLPMLRRMGRLQPNGQIQESSVPPEAHRDPGFGGGRQPLLPGAVA